MESDDAFLTSPIWRDKRDREVEIIIQLMCFRVFKSQNNVRSCNIITVNSTLRTLKNMLCIQSAKLVLLSLLLNGIETH